VCPLETLQENEYNYRYDTLRIDADADEFIKLVARGLNRYNIIKRETCIQLKNITIRLTEKDRQCYWDHAITFARWQHTARLLCQTPLFIAR